jgi:hypothetical protein
VTPETASDQGVLRFQQVRPRAAEPTHNPSVAGSSPARPTSKSEGQQASCVITVPLQIGCAPPWPRIGHELDTKLPA